jgi:hypothetical protein
MIGRLYLLRYRLECKNRELHRKLAIAQRKSKVETIDSDEQSSASDGDGDISIDEEDYNGDPASDDDLYGTPLNPNEGSDANRSSNQSFPQIKLLTKVILLLKLIMITRLK